MNCEQIAAILDDRDVTALTGLEHSSIAAHLETCASCRADWRAHARLVAKGIPALPDELPATIWQAIASGTPAVTTRCSRSRPFLLGGLLLRRGDARPAAAASGQ